MLVVVYEHRDHGTFTHASVRIVDDDTVVHTAATVEQAKAWVKRNGHTLGGTQLGLTETPVKEADHSGLSPYQLDVLRRVRGG